MAMPPASGPRKLPTWLAELRRPRAKPLRGSTSPYSRSVPRLALTALLLVLSCAAPSSPRATSSAITHVVVIGFDNYHFDDIQARMPNLYGFLQKGALSARSHHPGLPTKTAPGFASIASGQYPDRHGVINNSFLAPTSRSGFAYWENLTRRAPATFTSAPPWQGFTAAGWDVGAVGWQGLVLETKEEVAAHLGREPSAAEVDLYRGVAIHRKNGTAAIGTAEIPELGEEFPHGWVNGWDGPPRKHAPITLRMGTRLFQAGVPLVFIYVENTHGRCGAAPPCQFDLPAGSFNDLLEADDAAFGRFFDELAKLDLTPANTLFVLTTDEGDHYLAGFARAVDVADLQPAVFGSNALFYGGDADAIGAALAKRGALAVATREAMKALHLASGADARTPALMAFSEPDATYTRGACATCARWNHGTIHPDIADIWLGLVGPGLRAGPLDAYTDHVDIVPTIRALLGLPPAPDVDGVSIVTGDAQLRDAFKQLNAPHGKLAASILRISTRGVVGGAAVRTAADARIRDLATKRDALVTDVRAALESGTSAGELPRRAQDLLAEAER